MVTHHGSCFNHSEAGMQRREREQVKFCRKWRLPLERSRPLMRTLIWDMSTSPQSEMLHVKESH